MRISAYFYFDLTPLSLILFIILFFIVKIYYSFIMLFNYICLQFLYMISKC